MLQSRTNALLVVPTYSLGSHLPTYHPHMAQGLTRCQLGTSCLITPDLRRHIHFRPVSESKDRRRDIALMGSPRNPRPPLPQSCAALPCSRVWTRIWSAQCSFLNYLTLSSRIPIGCERRAMLLLLYSYTRDTSASADDFSGRTFSGSSRNGLSNHVWPEIPVSSHLSPPPLPFSHGTHGTPIPDGPHIKKMRPFPKSLETPGPCTPHVRNIGTVPL